uniref:Chromo domain-containing protein n=1 Tax=Parascaris equorum TaxID=6256 RepID=A0A914RA76_PAREQ
MVQQNQVFYLIKWKGYPVEESTWEPEENCKSSKDLIRKFEQTGQKKKSRKRVSESSQQVTLTKCGRAEPAEVPTDEGGAEAHGGMMASPPRERDTGTENLEGEAKREEDISCIVEAADAPETDDAQPDAEKSANEGDWDATNKLPSTPEPQFGSCALDHIIFYNSKFDFLFLVGMNGRFVLAKINDCESVAVKALVRYEDERYEMVPTRVLHIVAPRVSSFAFIGLPFCRLIYSGDLAPLGIWVYPLRDEVYCSRVWIFSARETIMCEMSSRH